MIIGVFTALTDERIGGGGSERGTTVAVAADGIRT